MRLHIVTVGQPKLAYAKLGWQEYLKRLEHYHQVRVTHLADKHAYDSGHLLRAAGNAYVVALMVGEAQLTSHELAAFLEKQSWGGKEHGKELCFIIGGPEGLPGPVIEKANLRLGLSRLTFPHDLAMVVLLEALYRASTISGGVPYHK